jgi:hypothetical protein
VNSPQPRASGLSALEARLPAQSTSTHSQINQWFDDYYWVPIKDQQRNIIGWKYEPTQCELIIPEHPTVGQLLSMGALAGIERITAKRRHERKRPAFVRD